MTEVVEFPEFITKAITVEKGDLRIFKGHITAEIIDKQQEFIFVKEVMKIMKTFMEVNPVISDYHSNRMVGKVLDYEQSSYQGVATVLITAQVYKKDGITLYDKVWKKVLSGEYSGLSMGGASKEREPIVKNGKMALELRKLELYEIALCDTPANAFAVIEAVNHFAKVNDIEDMVKEYNGRQQIKCTSIGCYFDKGTNIDHDIDIDNHEYVCVGSDKCDICKKSKEEHGMEQFDKPTEKLDSKTLVGRSAETRSASVGESVGSPKETNDILNTITNIPAKIKKDIGYTSTTYNKDPEKQKKEMSENIKDRDMAKDDPTIQEVMTTRSITREGNIKKDHIPSTPEHVEEDAKKKIKGELSGKRFETTNKLDPKSEGGGDPIEKDETVAEDIPKQWGKNVNTYIKHFGVDAVKKALEEEQVIEYLKSLHKKYN